MPLYVSQQATWTVSAGISYDQEPRIMRCEEASPGRGMRLGSAEQHRSGAWLYYAEKRD